MFNTLKLAICQEIFGDLPFSSICQKIAQIGYTGIEISPFKFHPDIRKLGVELRRNIVRTANQSNIELVACHWLLMSPPGLHITNPNPQVVSETRSFFMRLIDFANDLGVKRLIFGSPKQRSIDETWDHTCAMQLAIQFFHDMGDYARQFGITIAIEPLGASITNFAGSFEDCQQLLKTINHPNVKIILDISAMSRDSLPPMTQLAQLLVEDLIHVHVNDPNQLGPGMGDFQLKPIVCKLAHMGYRQWYSVETFRNDVTAESIALQSYEFMKKIL